MTVVRRLIAEVLSLPENIVFDANKEQDVSGIKAFLTVQVSFSDALGSERKYDSTNEREIITTVRNSTISINAFGNNAYQLIEKLVTSLKFSAIQQQFKSLGFSILSTSQIRNLATVISNAKEERAQVDLIANHIHRVSMSLGYGDSVDINYEVNK